MHAASTSPWAHASGQWRPAHRAAHPYPQRRNARDRGGHGDRVPGHRGCTDAVSATPTEPERAGSKITGKQVDVAWGMPGSIPLQLVQADPAMGAGAMMGVTYIQRVNTKGGVAPSDPCTATMAGTKKTVPYQADYVFYKS